MADCSDNNWLYIISIFIKFNDIMLNVQVILNPQWTFVTANENA